MSFVGKVVLIIGGSAGIGESTALLFAKEGADVAIVGRNEERLNSVSEKCSQYGKKAFIIKADITVDNEAKTIVQKTVEQFGKLDVLVNNAGIVQLGSIMSDSFLDDYDKMLNTNLRAPMHITSLAAPYLIKSKGNIVNVSSTYGQSYVGNSQFLLYAVSKAGLDHFARGAALELGASGVRVNTVCPGPVRTDILLKSGSTASWEDVRKMYKLDRVSEPEEVAEMILYIASDKAVGMNGSNVTIDNGCLLRN